MDTNTLCYCISNFLKVCTSRATEWQGTCSGLYTEFPRGGGGGGGGGEKKKKDFFFLKNKKQKKKKGGEGRELLVDRDLC